MPTKPLTAVAPRSMISLRVDSIAPAPEGQIRHRFDPALLQNLAASVKRSGIREPIIVTPEGSAPTRYRIVAGERRWRAAQLAGLAEIPCIIDEGLVAGRGR